ncbi:MAG: hypothetical protein J7L07_02880, partial [Candidatus Odinarchaeota archaeon]|nr:hypothetical protein [Candidatus Odinarchaeota archaeon]
IEIYFKILSGESVEYPKFKYVTVNPKYILKTKEQEEKIIHRLRLIKRYRLTDPIVITKIIKSAFDTPKYKLDRDELKFLKTLLGNPNDKIDKIAKKAKIPVSTAYRIYKKMKNVILLRRFGYPDLSRFRLKHFVVVFKFYEDKMDLLRRKMSLNPFLFTFNVDAINVYDGKAFGWASFRIPDSKKVLREFNDWLVSFKTELGVFPDEKSWEVIEAKRFIFSANIDFYDGEKWVFDETLMSVGLLKFVEKFDIYVNKPIINIEFNSKPIRFDKIDLILLELLQKDYFYKLSSARDVLEKEGYIRSEKNISRRFERLRNYVKPGVVFAGLNLADSLNLFISTSDKGTRDLIHKFLLYLPIVYIVESNSDMIIYIQLPKGTAIKFLYQFNELKNMVDEFLGIVVAYSHGAKIRVKLHEFWDEKKQRWIIPDGIMHGMY